MSRESMIDGHWDYSKGLLEAAGVGGQALAIAEYLYKQAFVHGIKHALEGDVGGDRHCGTCKYREYEGCVACRGCESDYSNWEAK